ncbi:MAG: hypothetical protein KC912_18000, partial [Proteobacteria bacterium]|nr:hypothetical protein [Pseudomonadota bacterium]
MRSASVLLFLAACSGSKTETVGDFEITVHSDGSLAIEHQLYGPVLEDMTVFAGEGSATIESSFGSYLFDDVEQSLRHPSKAKVRGRNQPLLIELADADGPIGDLVIASPGEDLLSLRLSATGNRKGFSAACDADDHFMGLGGHAMDVDHVGQAFDLWVSEPGIGKSEDEVPADNWFSKGTRHAASYPIPWLLRPHRSQGVLVDTSARVSVDLCATDPERFSATAWESDSLEWMVIAEPSPLEAVQHLTEWTGRPGLPPAWAFAPWNDAVRGEARVREVAARLRSFGAASSVIWTEDWKGASENGVGYHLEGEWFVDETLYPDATTLADELEADGFKWFAYFSPFLRTGTQTFDEAVEDGVVLRNEDNETYLFKGAQFEDETMVDLSTELGRDWARDRMRAALDLGFDGWMADYAEWLPTDAVLNGGEDALAVHNLFPEWWQQTNATLLDDYDMTFFVRSGWSRTSGIAPI